MESANRQTIFVISQVVWMSAAVIMVGRAFWYFHEWNWPLWKSIAALIVFPYTLFVLPSYLAFTAGDWSLVGAWAGALVFVGLSSLFSGK
jgi:hypothetical protein